MNTVIVQNNIDVYIHTINIMIKEFNRKNNDIEY